VLATMEPNVSLNYGEKPHDSRWKVRYRRLHCWGVFTGRLRRRRRRRRDPAGRPERQPRPEFAPQREPGPHRDAHRLADVEHQPSADGYADRSADGHAHADPHFNADADADGNADARAHGDTDRHAQPKRYAVRIDVDDRRSRRDTEAGFTR